MSEEDKITVLLPSLHGGGAEKVLLNIAGELAARGSLKDLIIISDHGPYKDQIPENVDTLNLRSNRGITAFPELVYYISEQEPDSLLTSIQVPNIVAIISTLVSRSDTRVFVRVSNVHSEKKNQAWKHHLIPPLIRLTYPRAHGVIAVSQGVKNDLVKNYNVPDENIHIINNPSFTKEIINRRGECPRLDVSNTNQPVILGIGRMTRQKDFQTLISAFAIVVENIDARLVILGDGEQRVELEKLISKHDLGDNVFMPGFVQNPYSYLYRADVFVLSSLFEGFPNVLVEALACQCPVVATNCPGGSREILDNGTYGELVEKRSPTKLAESILAILKGESKYDGEKLEERARKYNLDKITDDYVQLINQRY